MKRVLAVLVMLVLAIGGGAGLATAKSDGKCPTASHNPGGTPPNCGHAPDDGDDDGEEPCPPAGQITGIVVQVGQAISEGGNGEGEPLGAALIQVACGLHAALGI